MNRKSKNILQVVLVAIILATVLGVTHYLYRRVKNRKIKKPSLNPPQDTGSKSGTITPESPLYKFDLPKSMIKYQNIPTLEEIVGLFKSDPDLKQKYDDTVNFIRSSVIPYQIGQGSNAFKSIDVMGLPINFINNEIAFFDYKNVKLVFKLLKPSTNLAYSPKSTVFDPIEKLASNNLMRTTDWIRADFVHGKKPQKNYVGWVVISEYLPITGNLRNSKDTFELTDKSGKVDYPKKEILMRIFSRDVLAGFKALHDAGMAHIDFKPANVQGCIQNGKLLFKLIDLDTVTRIPDDKPGSVGFVIKHFFTMGFRLYNEWKNGRVGRFSDIFGLGVSLMYAGAINKSDECYRRANGCRQSSFRRDFFREYSFNTNFSYELRDFVALCVVSDKEKRIKIDELLGHPFITGDPLTIDAARRSALSGLVSSLNS
ncbi:hypothetical protein ECANGB1_2105 [Enterospora canceri]|uniref:Protein kinase domain-containing protein n=1 Tax=Enterospora canceri TaxID=1081671 RepID=A0A1Y1S9N7_9MICR|nr:hypothetical protein ECANGB1_2105 [Enterospora canceri]